MDIDKLERYLGSLQKNLERGVKYLEKNDYYSAIPAFTKVIDSLSDAAETAKKDSHPPIAISLYLQMLSQALIARQMCYLSIGEKEKAQVDSEMNDMVQGVINKINMQSETKLKEKKEEEGSPVLGCIGLIITILFIIKALS